VNTEDGQSPRSKGRNSKRSRDSSAEIAARRHQARMLALQVLYEVDLTDHNPDEAMARAFSEHGPLTDDVTSRVRALVGGVLDRRGEIDPILAAAAPARALEEQAAIERNVLRLASYELLYEPRVPPKVAINEGVELAKRFGGENSGKFVNGVLRTVLEDHPRPTMDTAAPGTG
jgi:transcription antitermination protein NusB